MALRRHFLATVMAATLLSASFLSSLGQDSHHTTFSVSILGGGTIAASLSTEPQTGFGSHNQDFMADERSATGPLFLTLLDMRGFASGWTVLIGTEDFRSPARHIGADALTLSPGAIFLRQGNPDFTGLSVFETGRMSTASMPMWSATPRFGDGEYVFTLDGSLSLPDTHNIGVYTFMVTIQGTAP